MKKNEIVLKTKKRPSESRNYTDRNFSETNRKALSIKQLNLFS